MVLDPDGRDEWEINGVTGKISRVNENKHYLDQNGSRIIVKAGEVYQGNADLSTLTEVDLLSNEKERTIDVSAGILGRQQTNEEEYQSFSFGSHAEAKDLYYFWAKSSNAEIAMCLTNTGGGHVGTDYSSENTRMTQLYESFFTSSISLMSHSHSGSGGPPSIGSPRRSGDLYNAANSKYDYKREVYDVPNNKIWEYDSRTYNEVVNRGYQMQWRRAK